MIAAIQWIALGAQYVGDVMVCIGTLTFLCLVKMDGGLR